MDFSDLENVRMVAWALANLNRSPRAGSPKYTADEVRGFMEREFGSRHTVDEINSAIRAATVFSRGAQQARSAIEHGNTQQMNRALREFIGQRPNITGPRQQLGVTVYYKGHLVNGRFVEGSTIVNVDEGASLQMTQRRLQAAICGSHIGSAANYQFRDCSITIMTITAYPRADAPTLDTAPISPTHPNPYRGAP